MDEQLQRDINTILKHLEFISDAQETGQEGQAAPAGEDTAALGAQPEPEQPEPQHAPPASPPPIIVYLVDTPPLEAYDGYDQDYYPDASASTVESLPETEEEPATPTADDERETEVPLPPPQDSLLSPPAIAPRRKSKRGVLVGVLCLLLAGLAITAYLLSPLTASATVTIIPQSREISTTITLTVVTAETANSLKHEVPGRLLSSLTLSQEQTVQTTGTGHQDAQAAHGLITFYNASLVVQTVTAGTLLTGTDGLQVVTDEDAVIPAGSLSINGAVTVPAHALQVGPAGNIQAEDIYGPCCRLNVFVQNRSAFYGGQNARSFPMVTQADMNRVVASLKTSLMQSIQAAFAVQVHPDESLLVPRCTPSVTANHAVGDEATSLGATVEEICMDVAYTTQAVHDLVAQIVTEEASRHVGAGYRLIGDVEASVLRSTVNEQKQGSMTLQVKGAGVWSYQFSEAALEQLAGRIAGKSVREARTLLLSVPGVQSVSIQLNGEGENSPTLPSNPGQIKMGQLITFGL